MRQLLGRLAEKGLPCVVALDMNGAPPRKGSKYPSMAYPLVAVSEQLAGPKVIAAHGPWSPAGSLALSPPHMSPRGPTD